MTNKLSGLNKLVKLDARYNGHHQFTHKVVFDGAGFTRRKNFIAAVHWLYKQFGPSIEQSLVYCMDVEPLWAYESDQGYNTNIFLKGAALTQFLLVKERFEENYG